MIWKTKNLKKFGSFCNAVDVSFYWLNLEILLWKKASNTCDNRKQCFKAISQTVLDKTAWLVFCLCSFGVFICWITLKYNYQHKGYWNINIITKDIWIKLSIFVNINGWIEKSKKHIKQHKKQHKKQYKKQYKKTFKFF